MVQPDRLSFPKPEELLEEIQKFSQGDQYGESVLQLERALRPYDRPRRGSITGLRQWLLASELARQRVLYDSVGDLLTPGKLGVDIPLVVSWLKDWPRKPARYVQWNTMLNVVTNKSVKLIKGKFRKIPTPTQIEFVRRGILHGDRADKNVVVFEPLPNIHVLESQTTTAFPDTLRATMWKHIPLINLVVKNNNFALKDPFLSWIHNHQEVRRKARKYEPIEDLFDKAQWKKSRAAGRSNIRWIWVDDTSKYRADYKGYSTSIWESQCTGEERFIDLAMRFLVTRQG